ncbi:NAD(P)-binding Rossmann-fold superfamily protein [Hibiscus syriacus]|uniref:NAD(P)-binding Rossmann-fold superfamily protein n=1 Tax=Hibiscus syriacus TaxID=106335 RepID=A0A6A2ZY64_HIBSY|nr:NAD(P)-binding Rossmann-fold superfamily protein [Hibiscus syriacus]
MTLTLTLSPGSTPHEAKPEERGIRLIQLLLTCAKHASTGNLHRADECLRQISLLAFVPGDSMQRLSTWFTSALASLIGQAFPYLGLSYAIISHTLIKATTGQRVIHLIDLGSGDPNLWIPLIRSFSCLHTETPHLKITCMNANRAILEDLGTRLVKEAETLDIPFQFSPLNVNLRELTLDKLKRGVRFGRCYAWANTWSGERLVLEEMFWKEIENIVACEGVERVERHERYGRWMVLFGQAGFKPVRMWHDSMEDAKQMMEACGRNGYKIVNEKASLMICWHDRPLYAVSTWTC